MNKDVLGLMVDLEKKKLKKQHGIILIDNDRVKQTGEIFSLSDFITDRDIGDTYVFDIDGTPAYVKSADNQSFYALGKSRKYNDIGIATPITTLIKNKNEDRLFTASQDLDSLNNDKFIITLAKEIPEFTKLRMDAIAWGNGGDRDGKWEALSPDIKEKFLSFMTEECFDDFITLSAVNELHTYTDGHCNNLFFYKTTPKGKYEGIIPIDLEYSEILREVYYKDGKLDFNNFKRYPYTAFNLLSRGEYPKTLDERIHDLKEIIQAGKLKNSQIDTIKKSVNYNLSGLLTNLRKKYGIKDNAKKVIEMIKRLEEDVYNEFGKEI